MQNYLLYFILIISLISIGISVYNIINKPKCPTSCPLPSTQKDFPVNLPESSKIVKLNEDLTNVKTKLDEEYYDKKTLDNKLNSDFCNKTYLETKLEDKADKSYVDKLSFETNGINLENYYTKEDMNTKIDSYNEQLDTKLLQKIDTFEVDKKFDDVTDKFLSYNLKLNEKEDKGIFDTLSSKIDDRFSLYDTKLLEKTDKIYVDNINSAATLTNNEKFSTINAKLDEKEDKTNSESLYKDFNQKLSDYDIKLQTKADKNYVDSIAAQASGISLSDYYTKGEINTQLDNKANKSYIDEMVAKESGISLSDYYTSSQMDDKLTNYYDKDYINKQYSSYDKILSSKVNQNSFDLALLDKANNSQLEKLNTDLTTNYYDKINLDDKFGKYYNKTDLDSRFSTYDNVLIEKADKLSVNSISNNFSNYFNKSEINDKLLSYDNLLSRKVDNSYADDKFTTLNSTISSINKENITFSNSLKDKADKSYIDGNFYNKSYIDGNFYNKEQIFTKEQINAQFLKSNPIGTIIAFGGEISPVGFLPCDGSSVSRTTYSKLFSIIQNIYGNGDGTTTFNLPNIKGRVLVGNGKGDVSERILGEKGGVEKVSLTTDQLPSHSHSGNLSMKFPTYGYYVTSNNGKPEVLSNPQRGITNGDVSITSQLNTNNTGSGTAHENMQPYLVVNYFIKSE